MANYYTKNRKFYLDQIDLNEIVAHRENNYQSPEAKALHSYEEALTWYDMLLKNAGDICANFIEPRAEAVDEKGAQFCDGVVTWAPETQENMQVLAQAGYMGGILERKYGGLNLPATVNTLIIEMVSQADASLMNLFGLQDIGVTLSKFGTEEQKDRVLPKFCTGEVSGSMALTEPDAGSDLQAVACKAILKDDKWYLDGVKRFITNGCGDVSLVLARTEAGSSDGRGLSMMLYERYRDDNMTIRRIEDKMGIHGSPTCELQFDMAECELVGKRRFGLIKYILDLMNGARLAVSAQALGIAQAAFNEALDYANKREQFGQKIANLPPVYQMLKKSQAEIETARMLLYDTAFHVDIDNMYQEKAKTGETDKKELKTAGAIANFLTPISKFVTTEMSNKVCYDAVQIHGGCGFVKDFPVERLARDARITNIYEGTTQLQVIAALAGVKANVLEKKFNDFSASTIDNLNNEKTIIIDFIEQYNNLIEKLKELDSKELFSYVGNYVVEIVSILYRLMLFIKAANKHEEKRDLFKFYLTESETHIPYLINKIEKLMTSYGDNISDLKKDLIK
ncbi:MAG: acyl-CoA dehydrogenase family protein [Gammaproteobacteria bacterium]|nr:acyl-CoA dehydrogenase family protein [Gammaproteobacteria bacterium]